MNLSDLPIDILTVIGKISTSLHLSLCLVLRKYNDYYSYKDNRLAIQKYFTTILERPGYKEYRINNKLHRENGPAIEILSGKAYYINGLLHRIDGPAYVHMNGYKEYYYEGKLHNPNGPAVDWGEEKQEWWIHGELHNTNGPARILNGNYKEYYIHGKLHRDDGPAVIHPDGVEEYWTNGVKTKVIKHDKIIIYRNNK